MKKKLLVALLAATAAVCGAFGLSACGNGNDNNEHGSSEWGDGYSVQSAYALAKDLGYTGTLEEFIATISGKDGADGKDGVGIDNAYIDDEGCLILVLTDKKTINCGKISTSVVENQNFQYVTLKENNAVTGYAIAGIKTGTVIDSDLIIPSTYQGKPVKEIAQEAFKDCKHFISVTIPDSVTAIGNSAFNGCNSIAEIKYDGKIESWCGISGLYSLMNNGITERKLFIDGTEIKGNLAIPTGVTQISDYVFFRCSSVTGLTIPNGVTTIGNSAFSGCSSVTSLTIPNGVTTIGNSAFSGCSSVTSLTIPNSVTTIGNSAFSGFKSVKSLTIPNSVTAIGKSAFSGCSSLESITLPFIGATKHGTEDTHFGYIFGASGYYSNLDTVLSTLKTVIITGGERIGENAFYNCENIVSITIPQSLTEIGSSAFSGCKSLAEIRYTGDISSWCGISGLYSLMVNGITGKKLFINNNEIKGNLVIPTGVTEISDYAFFRYSSVTSLTIPNSVTTIGDSAFENCSSVTSLTIPNSVTTIGYSAFENCSSLESISIPFVGAEKDGTENTHFGYIFGASGYYENVNYVPASLKTVIITGGKKISEDAFYICENIVSVTIPQSVTEIDAYAFHDCTALTDIHYNGTRLQWYNIEKGTSWIDKYSSEYTVHCTDGIY